MMIPEDEFNAKSTVMLLVPAPLMIVAPAGMDQMYEVALGMTGMMKITPFCPGTLH